MQHQPSTRWCQTFLINYLLINTGNINSACQCNIGSILCKTEQLNIEIRFRRCRKSPARFTWHASAYHYRASCSWYSTTQLNNSVRGSTVQHRVSVGTNASQLNSGQYLTVISFAFHSVYFYSLFSNVCILSQSSLWHWARIFVQGYTK